MPEPECPPGGALLEILACAVCGTDAKMYRLGHRDLVYPRILGHEIVGQIARIDKDCGLRPGDTVAVWPGIACQRCRPCQKGEDNRCQEMKILGFSRDGGFADYLALPPQSIPRGANLLPRGADPAIATLAEPLACCINGQEMARVSRGDFVLIIGAGPTGCLHALLAELYGAERIVVVEKLAHRLRQIEKHTKAETIGIEDDGFSGSLADRIRREMGGANADVIITATPMITVDAHLCQLLAPGGRLCVFSGPRAEDRESLMDLGSVHYRELTIAGSYGCSSRQNRKAAELLSTGQVDAGWIITKREPLSGIHKALRHCDCREGLKSVICRT